MLYLKTHLRNIKTSVKMIIKTQKVQLHGSNIMFAYSFKTVILNCNTVYMQTKKMHFYSSGRNVI